MKMIIKEKNNDDILKVNCNKEGIEKASQIVSQGGIVIFPTDTVYGIGCNPYNKESVEKIYKIKSRNGRPIISSRASACEKNLAPGRGQSVGADPNAPFCARSKSENFSRGVFRFFLFQRFLFLYLFLIKYFVISICFRRSVTKYRVDTAHTLGARKDIINMQ